MSGPVFVTGGSGYVGSALLRIAPRRESAPIRVLVRDPSRIPPDLREAPGIEIVVGDLLEPAPWAPYAADASHVIHLAAVTGKARPGRYHSVHVEGTANLLSALRCAPLEGFLQVSTIAVAFSDKTRYAYARTKQRAEALVAASGLPFTILRPTMVIGPGAPVLEGLDRMANAFIMPVFGRGDVRVQPIDVGDLTRAIWELVNRHAFEGRIIELGGPEVLSIEALLGRLRAIRSGRRPRTLHLPLRPIRFVLGLLEPLLLPVLPLTAGQLATFANPGTASKSALADAWMGEMRPLEESLRGALADV